MKWLFVVGALAVISSLSGCCQPGGGLFNRQPAYGTTYSPSNYYAPQATTYAPATNNANPCACQ
jgi:hypothetical protein